MAYNGHFAKNCFHPLFGFTSDGDCLEARLRPGKVHSADGALEFVKPVLECYRGDAAFAKPEICEYCEDQRVIYFIWLPANGTLDNLVGRPPKSGIQVKIGVFWYQAGSWSRPRRVVAKIEWHQGELLTRLGFVVTNSRLPAW